MAPYDAFDVLANLWFLNVPLDPENYSEGENHGVHAKVEYAVELVRHRPNRAGADPASGPVYGTMAQEWDKKIDEVFTYALLGRMAGRPRGEDSQDELAKIEHSLMVQEFYIRARSFAHQERQTAVSAG